MDRYIDAFEVSEYGSYFYEQSGRLVGASKLVDVEALRKELQGKQRAVEKERDAAGLVRSGLRGNQQGASEAVTQVREVLTRFFNYLGSVDPAECKVDIAAFFPGGTLGALVQMKPADLKGHADRVLGGFALPAHQSLPEREKWQTRLTQARDGLASALSSKSDQQNTKLESTGKLGAAREEFLSVYNGVAKPLVRGLLASLGKSAEYEHFFRDLQVNEEGRPAKAPPAPSA